MKLTATTVLEGVAVALREQISPRLNDSFAADVARIAQTLVSIVARAGDDAVCIRVQENARMRALFAKAQQVIGDGDLASRLKQAAQSTDPGLKLSELDAETGRLRKLLIELHGELEDRSETQARALDQEIWRAMREFEQARAPRA
jgi:hypothetical protein